MKRRDFFKNAGLMAAGIAISPELMAKGILLEDKEDSFYIYQMEFKLDGETVTVEGVTGRCRLEPFDTGVVLPHENTLSKAKDDRLSLLRACKANISSIYSLFGDENGAFQNLISRIIAETKPGSVIEITVLRDGVEKKLKVTVAEDLLH